MFNLSSDQSLVRGALKGRSDAWEKLIMRYERKIFNFGLRMTGNREDAMDLMQDIFFAVYRNLNKYQGKAPFSAWLFKIASHRCIDLFRKRKGIEPLPVEETQLEDAYPAANPFHHLLKYETNQKVLALLEQLPAEQRLVVELKFFQELTFEEMGSLLGISTNTLKSRLYGALKKMKTMPEVVHAM